MRRQRNKTFLWKTISGCNRNACETFIRKCQERTRVLSSTPTDQTHLTWCVTVCITAIIVYREIFQANNVELISRVIWQCAAPLLELFSRDKGRHTGGLACPSHLACHQVGSSWPIRWRVEPLFQCRVITSDWTCSTDELSNILGLFSYSWTNH